MTKEKKEQLSNRLVLNFGILLLGALAMLYVNSAIRSYQIRNTAYTIILMVGILGLIAAVGLFAYGKKNNPKLKNYSAVGLGVAIASAIIYCAKLNIASFYTATFAVVTVYLLMLVYFIIMAIYTAIQMKKPIEKDPEAVAKAKAMQKNKKKKRK